MSEIRKLAAILVADIVGYSRLAGADEDRILSRLRALRTLKRRARRLQELKLRLCRGSAEDGVSMREAPEHGDDLQMKSRIFDGAVVGRPFAQELESKPLVFDVL